MGWGVHRSYLSGRDHEVVSPDAPSPVDATTVRLVENPFKRGTSESSAAVWKAVLERTTAEKPRALATDEADKIDRIHKRGLNGLVVASADRSQHRRKVRRDDLLMVWR